MSDRKKNPYKPGTARYREWNRANKSPRRVEKKVPSDTSKRRKQLDEQIEGQISQRLRDRQTTDSNN